MILQQKVRVRVSVVPNIFMISLTFVRNSNGSHGTVGRTTGFWSGRYGFESQPSHTFLIIGTENHDTPSLLSPPLVFSFFAPGNLLKHSTQGFPFEIFRYCEKKFSIENLDFPLLGIKFLDTRNFLKHRRAPVRNFSALWDKNFPTESRHTLQQKLQKLVLELMFVKTLWKLKSKQ